MKIANNKLFTFAFTLIELLVVMIIMGIAFAFVTVRFVSFNARHHAQAQMEEINAVLAYARNRAVIDNTPVSVKLRDKGYVVSELVCENITADKNIVVQEKILKNTTYQTKSKKHVVIDKAVLLKDDNRLVFSASGLVVPYKIRLID